MVTTPHSGTYTESMPLQIRADSAFGENRWLPKHILLTKPVSAKLPSAVVVSANPYFSSFTTDPAMAVTPEVSVTVPHILICCEKTTHVITATDIITFKEIMDSYQKPYLVLQIDEHDSEIGYDTRIEAAIRTFRTDFHGNKSIIKNTKAVTVDRSFMKNGNVLIPNYDWLSCSLICAAFEREGYRAFLIEESPT